MTGTHCKSESGRGNLDDSRSINVTRMMFSIYVIWSDGWKVHRVATSVSSLVHAGVAGVDETVRVVSYCSQMSKGSFF